MVEAWVTRRYVRFFSAGGVLIGGFIVARQLLYISGFRAVVIIFSIGLAALVGAGKLASP